MLDFHVTLDLPMLKDPFTELRGKRILVTGGLGFIGSNIVNRCVNLGAKVSVYDCLDPKSGGNMHNVHEVLNDIEIIVNDVRNLEALCTAVMNKDIVFNCAAFTSHPNSMREPQVDIDVNCRGTINLLEAMRRFNPQVKLVHTGTSTQIGKMQHNVIDETHCEFPVDIYSANKTAAEKYIVVYGHAYNLRTTVVRLANVYGPRSNIRSPDFGFMNYFVGLGLKNKQLSVFGSGSQVRTITYVEDVVDALLSAAQEPKTDRQVFFAVADQRYSVSQIAQSISEVIGGTVSFISWPKEREAIEIGDAIISNEKIKSLIDWSAGTDLAAGLAKTRDYYQPCLNHYL